MSRHSRFPLTDADGFPLPNEVGVPDYIAEFAADTAAMTAARHDEFARNRHLLSANPIDRSARGVRKKDPVGCGWMAARGD